MTIRVDTRRLQGELETLAGFTECPQTGKPDERAVTRIVFSEDDLRARAWLRSLYEAAGLEVREDAVGNVFARWQGTEPELAAVGTGSHTDAIPFAGMYDGTVGVLGGLEAIRALQAAGIRPRRSIELLMFTSEEPTRFGIGCLGSRLLSGTLDPAKADTMRDADGATLAEVRHKAGFTGDLAQVQLRAGYYHAWAELHIEQGPLLEREGIAIGAVSAIAAPASYSITIEGFGGHAGALLMPDRRDALCAASEIILAVERYALATGAVDTVATVGRVQVHPGAVNSVPSRVVLDLDIRDVDPQRRESVMAGVREVCEQLRSTRSVRISEQKINADAPALAADAIVSEVEASAAEHGLSCRRMVSRAYHDTLFMARLAPVGMIFIPCRNGVSHRPDEYSSPQALEAGVAVLASTLARLANQP